MALHGTVGGTNARAAKLQRRDNGLLVADDPHPIPLIRSKSGDSRYRIHVATAGRYRVTAGWVAGPELRVAPPLVGYAQVI